MRGRIDDTEVYLDEDQLPAFSLSVNSITDPDKIKGTSSTTLRVLSTPESRRAVGTHFMDERRRTKRPVLRIGEDSVDLFRSDVVVLEQDRDVIECMALGGNATWFEWAKKTKLRDVINGESTPINEEFIKSTWLDEDGLLYFPLIDFGELEDRSSSYNVVVTSMRPGFRIHRILNDAFIAAGYRLSIQGAAADAWKKYVMIDPKERILTPRFYGHPQWVEAANSGSGPGSGFTMNEVGDAIIVDNLFPLNAVGEDPGGNVNPAGFSVYEVPAGFTGVRIRVDKLGVSFDPFSPPPDGTQFFLHVYNFTTSTILDSVSLTFDGAASDYNARWWHTFEINGVAAGDEIALVFQCEAGSGLGGSVEVASESRYAIEPIDPLWAQQFYLYSADEWVSNTTITIESALPDMSVMDLLKSMVDLQCLVVSTDERAKRIVLIGWSDYFTKAVPGLPSRQWASRMDHTTAPKRVRPDRYSRMMFRYKEDQDDEGLWITNASMKYPGYANADVVNDEGLQKEITISLPFAPSVSGEVLGGLTVPLMRAKDGAYQVSDYDRELRILIADGVKSGSWHLGPVEDTEYPYCYFTTTDPDGIALPWGNAAAGYPLVIDDQWEQRVREMTTTRTLECYLLLRDHELRNFHHGIPTLVDDGSGPRWYYVQEIFQHRFGKNIPTKCILVEIPGALDLRGDLRNPALTYPPVNPEPEITLGFFTIDLTHGLLYTVQGVTFVCVLHAGAFSPGSDPVGEFSPNPTYGVVLQQGSDLYALVLNPSPVGPGYDVTNELTFDATNGLMVTIASTTYQADTIQL